jgi:prepilin-type N-terminal cleavage/methylation domain-containing protein/prepilin-type processing-associated H-X9-DG protein
MGDDTFFRMRSRGFTLIELLVVITILVVLAALAVPGTYKAIEYAHKTRSLSNMRQIGMGIQFYAQENNNAVPRRGNGNGSDGKPNQKWPSAVAEYLQDTSVFIDYDDPESVASTPEDLVANSGNKTAYLMNGFNDLGAYNNTDFMLNMARLKNPSGTILLGQKMATSRQYYMDFVEGPGGNQNDVLNKKAFGKGANYVFADGSARFMSESEYHDEMWLINADYQIPTF